MPEDRPQPPIPVPERTTCPNCGANLIALDVDAFPADTPPYLCQVCHRGWWGVEITERGRRAWNGEYREFRGWPERAALVSNERADRSLRRAARIQQEAQNN